MKQLWETLIETAIWAAGLVAILMGIAAVLLPLFLLLDALGEM